MVKQKKKRTKAYSGNDAVNARPIVTHISAANRGRLGQWWYDHRLYRKPALIVAAILFAVIVVIFGIISLIGSFR